MNITDTSRTAMDSAPSFIGGPTRRAVRLRAGLIRQGALAGVLVAFVVVFSVLGSGFFSLLTWQSTSEYASEFLILGAAETFVILSGGIDLSVGAIAGLTGVVSAWTMGATASLGDGASITIGVLVGLAVGLAVGLLNGVLVSRMRITPFIATLGTLGIASGLGYVISGGTPITSVPPAVGRIVNTVLAGGWLPVLFLVGAIVVVFSMWLLTATRFGTYVRAIGSNAKGAREAGVPHRSVYLRVYLLSGTFSAIAGILLMSRFVIGSPLTGANDELNAIAAVVIGGASLSGGRGTLGGTVLGAFIISILVTGLIALGVPAFWQVVAVGVVIVVSVGIDQLRDRSGRDS